MKLWYIPAGIEVSFLMDEGRQTDVKIEIGTYLDTLFMFYKQLL